MRSSNRFLSRRLFLQQTGRASLSAAAAWVFARDGGAHAATPDKRIPNFVFILIDDMGARDLGCTGSTFYETPAIDRLASRSMLFNNAYAAAPVCSPSRAAIHSGKTPARLRLTDWIPGRKQRPAAKLLVPSFEQQLALEETTMAETLKAAGYVCASIGKWHLGGESFLPVNQGFDVNVGGGAMGGVKSHFGPFNLPGLGTGLSEEYLTERLTEEAEAFMETHARNPFFLFLSHYTVHIPLNARQKAIDKYQGKSSPGQGQNHPVYAAMIDSLDACVGRLLAKLEALGIADRTVVVFTSDNGGLRFEGGSKASVTDNSPLRAGKGHLYEGGIRVPLIVRWPGVTDAGGSCGVPVSGIDFFPTLLEMAGVGTSLPRTVDGRSMVPLLKNSGRFKERDLYWHYPHYSNQGGKPSGAVRSGDYKLIEFYEDGRTELYNLKQDPGEKDNRAEREPKRAAAMKKKLAAWRESVRAVMPSENPDFDPSRADQGLTGSTL